MDGCRLILFLVLVLLFPILSVFNKTGKEGKLHNAIPNNSCLALLFENIIIVIIFMSIVTHSHHHHHRRHRPNYYEAYKFIYIAFVIQTSFTLTKLYTIIFVFNFRYWFSIGLFFFTSFSFIIFSIILMRFKFDGDRNTKIRRKSEKENYIKMSATHRSIEKPNC